MRKLNVKNKTYIAALSIFVIICLVGAALFIVYKLADLNIQYDITKGSYVYNAKSELVAIKDDTYAKKNLLGNYYAVVGENKIDIGSAPVIYNEEKRRVTLLGTFFEILANGEINKLKGQTTIENIAVSRIYKIDDRRYLVISSNITSTDGSLNAKDYLLVNIDKAGNAYLYNNEVNIKTFDKLELITPEFTFKVNEEKLIRDEEEIDLAKINGSTNEYVPEPDDEDDGEGDGTGDGSGDGSGGVAPTPEPEEVPLPEGELVVITGTVTEEKYISRKTTIIGLETTTSEIKFDYLVYDPFKEYRSIYTKVSSGGVDIGTYNIDEDLTSSTISGLSANQTYRLDFYYSYLDAQGNEVNTLFDTMVATTKTITGKITLEKTTTNSVRYIVKIDGNYKLDSASVNLYIDGTVVGSLPVDTEKARSAEGYTGEIVFEGAGEFGILKLTDCLYNGAPINIDATYKYKM